MSDIETLMRSWLATGTPDQQRHAAARIAIGFGQALPPLSTQAANLPRPTPPPLAVRVKNYAVAVVKDLAAGRPRFSDEVVAARLAVCRPCDQRTEDGVCADRRCGCVLEEKARWGGQVCPLGKWPEPPPAP